MSDNDGLLCDAFVQKLSGTVTVLPRNIVYRDVELALSYVWAKSEPAEFYLHQPRLCYYFL